MHAFAALLDALVYSPARNAKLRLIRDYIRSTPDPDRGWAMAALTGDLDFPAVKAGLIRQLIEDRVDPVLFRLSRDYVGDTAETVALLWPEPLSGNADQNAAPSVKHIVETLKAATRATAPSIVTSLLDSVPMEARYALIKLATGGMRVGVSARLAKTAIAHAFDADVDKIEEYWHGLEPPFAPLFDWLEGRGPEPDMRARAIFRPFMLAHPLEDDAQLDLAEFVAEWKWDGIRVQLVSTLTETRLFSRGGEDISAAFPDVTLPTPMPIVLDGELLVRGMDQGGEGGGAASFNALQQRLGRKSVSAKMLSESPAFIRAYDLLDLEQQDLRALPWVDRRQQLEAILPKLDQARFDLSAIVQADSWDSLSELRDAARDDGVEGLMLKRRDSPYSGGRKVGHWYKWKRDPLTADCVMMYAQRGSGKRSSFYSDYTFGAWAADGSLLPVGKAYSGFTDAELKWLDQFVRAKTIGRFGPVREVEKTLVLEVAFDSIHASKRHKSGLAMRFPRIKRIRTDKPAAEADRIETLQALADA
jgi:DNA ligase 1